MNSWFECKVKYNKIDEQTGMDKPVTEPYLIDAMTFTEAEERIYKEMEAYIRGEFQVANIKREKLSDLFPNDEGDKWYKCKVVYVDVDEESGKEKKSAHNMLVMGNNLKMAVENLEKNLSQILIPWELKSIAESPLMDVFQYNGSLTEDIQEVED